MTAKQHRGSTAFALSVLLTLAVSFTVQAATVDFVAHDETTGPAWLDTGVAKEHDADGDNVYGTDG